MVGWILVSFFFWGLEDDWKQFVWEDGFVGSWGFRLKNTLLLKGLWSCCHLLFNASPSRNHQSHFRRVSRASGNSFTDMRPYGDQLWLFLQQKHLQISKDLKREISETNFLSLLVLLEKSLPNTYKMTILKGKSPVSFSWDSKDALINYCINKLKWVRSWLAVETLGFMERVKLPTVFLPFCIWSFHKHHQNLIRNNDKKHWHHRPNSRVYPIYN